MPDQGRRSAKRITCWKVDRLVKHIVSGMNPGMNWMRGAGSRQAVGSGPWAAASYAFFNLSSCVANGNRALPSDHLRVIDRESDAFAGGNATPTGPTTRASLASPVGPLHSTACRRTGVAGTSSGSALAGTSHSRNWKLEHLPRPALRTQISSKARTPQRGRVALDMTDAAEIANVPDRGRCCAGRASGTAHL